MNFFILVLFIVIIIYLFHKVVYNCIIVVIYRLSAITIIIGASAPVEFYSGASL